MRSCWLLPGLLAWMSRLRCPEEVCVLGACGGLHLHLACLLDGFRPALRHQQRLEAHALLSLEGQDLVRRLGRRQRAGRIGAGGLKALKRALV